MAHKAHARAVSEYKRGSFVGQFMLKSLVVRSTWSPDSVVQHAWRTKTIRCCVTDCYNSERELLADQKVNMKAELNSK